MEERIYKFVDKMFDVEYMVTKAELEVLNQSYRKERYMLKEQGRVMGTYSFSDYDSEDDYGMEETLSDGHDMVQELTTEIMLKHLLSGLTEKERKVLELNVMEGYTQKEVGKILGCSDRSVLRIKNSALEKLHEKMEEMGISNFGEACADFL